MALRYRNFFVVFLTITAILLPSTTASFSTFGDRRSGDRVVLDEKLSHEWTMWGYLRLPLHYRFPGMIITRLETMNLGRTFRYQFYGGGPGADYVYLHLTSEPWRGIYVRIKIYAINYDVSEWTPKSS